MNDLFTADTAVDLGAMLANLRTWWIVAPKEEKKAINVTGKALRDGLTDTLQRRYNAHQRRFTANCYDV